MTDITTIPDEELRKDLDESKGLVKVIEAELARRGKSSVVVAKP
ncbi:MAG: hypothetical protein ABR999_10745 [Methanoregula sp.]|jgi:hypothetical protein